MGQPSPAAESPCPAPRSFVLSVYHPVMEFVFCFLIDYIYCILLLALGFLWGPRSTEALGERGSGPPGHCTVELWPLG